jgi:DNA-binding NarL/FixJ family response regulator
MGYAPQFQQSFWAPGATPRVRAPRPDARIPVGREELAAGPLPAGGQGQGAARRRHTDEESGGQNSRSRRLRRRQFALLSATMKIAVVEDHALMRGLLVKACGEAMAGSVVSGARNAEAGLALCRAEQPDVIILDLGLPDCDGLDVLDDLLATCPGSKVIGISGYADDFTLHRALHSKLHGFVDKNEQTVEQLAAAIHAVLNGARYLSPAAQRAQLSQQRDPAAFDKILSVREQDLLRLFGRGLSNEEIAAAVNLSELTVRNHRCRTMAKLGLHTTAELIRYALDKGFTHPEPTGRLDRRLG